MPKLTKKPVDALQKRARSDAVLRGSGLRGFGVRMQPSGTKTFVIGQYGVLSVKMARDLAKDKLASAIDGVAPCVHSLLQC
jgi:hypothetical protein